MGGKNENITNSIGLGFNYYDWGDNYKLSIFEDEVDMTGLTLGFETGYTFDSNISLYLEYKAVETEVTVENNFSGDKYSEDGYTHLGYLGIGYNF